LKQFRIRAKTVNGTPGNAGKPFANVIRRKWEWRCGRLKLANENRGDQRDKNYKNPSIRQAQSVSSHCLSSNKSSHCRTLDHCLTFALAHWLRRSFHWKLVWQSTD